MIFLIIISGGNKGGGGVCVCEYFIFKVLTLTGCTRQIGVPRYASGREPGRDREVVARTT